MSWCRWSSMEFACDLYVFDSAYGVEVNVARRRHVIDRSTLPPGDDDICSDASFARHRALTDLLNSCEEYEVIDLPHAGEWRVFDELSEAADFIDELAALGYVVPPGMTDEMRSCEE